MIILEASIGDTLVELTLTFMYFGQSRGETNRENLCHQVRCRVRKLKSGSSRINLVQIS